MSNSDTINKHKDYLFPAVTMYYQEPLALERGEGMHVWDEAGNKYLDCFGGVLTTSVVAARSVVHPVHGARRQQRFRAGHEGHGQPVFSGPAGRPLLGASNPDAA